MKDSVMESRNLGIRKNTFIVERYCEQLEQCVRAGDVSCWLVKEKCVQLILELSMVLKPEASIHTSRCYMVEQDIIEKAMLHTKCFTVYVCMCVCVLVFCILMS